MLLRYWIALVNIILCLLELFSKIIYFIFAFYYMNDNYQHRKIFILSWLITVIERYCYKKIFKIL